jgi:exosortase A
MTQSTASTHRAWRTALPVFAILLACVIGLYFDTAQAIVNIWIRSETFTHGFLVPPIVVWLVWRKRQTIAQIVPQPSLLTGSLIAGAAFAWLLGDLAAVNALRQLAFVSLIILLVPAVMGWTVARSIAFPLAFLFFAVPFGEFAMPQLMEWTADFTVLALRLTGIPVFREGLQFVIPSGNWSVVEACSGVRYLIASLTVGTLFAYLNYQSTSRRVLFIALSLLVPVVANWMRAYLIVLLGHLSGNKLATGVDHLIYGWVFFGVVIMLMFMLGARWSEPTPEPASLATPPGGDSRSASLAFTCTTAICFAILLAAPVIAHNAINGSNHALATPQLTAPESWGSGWRSTALRPTNWQPAFQNPSVQIQAAYANGEQVVGLYLGYYNRQSDDSKLVSSENVLVKSKDPQWVQVSRGTRTLELDGKTLAIRTAELGGTPFAGQAKDDRLVVWQVYWVNGTLTASDALAKAYAAGFSLIGRGDDSAVILVYALKGEAGHGERAIEDFLRANLPDIRKLLEAANP